jgi:hypothetical protein
VDEDRAVAGVRAADGERVVWREDEGVPGLGVAQAAPAGQRAVGDLAGRGFWPVSGALLVNLRNILEALGPVADAQPVEVPAPALVTLRRRTAAGAVVRSAGE